MDKVDEMRRKLISAAKRKVQEKYEDRDVHIIKSVNLLEDLDSVANLLTEQLREWYSVHFPELNEMVPDQKVYLSLCHYLGGRQNFTAEKVLERLANNDDRETAGKIVAASRDSIGSEVSQEDLDEMRSVALNCLNIMEEREAISKYIEQAMEKELPNFSAIAGATIGAKILAKIGSKQKLAFVPASTLQIVGAEKALFLHIKMGVKGPKYGYLYQHQLVKAASYENKGRMARSIASKLSIAAKMDYFRSSGNAYGMKKQLEQRAKELAGRKHKEKAAKSEEPTKAEEAIAPRKEFFERPRPQFREKPQFGAERRGNFQQRGPGSFRNERPSGFRRNDRPDGGLRHNDRPTGFRPRQERAAGFGAEGSNKRRSFGDNRGRDIGPGGARSPWKGGRGHDQRRPFGGEGNRSGRLAGRPFRGGAQKRDFHSTERKAFGNDGPVKGGSFRPEGRHGRAHLSRGGKFHSKGKNKGDPARKRF